MLSHVLKSLFLVSFVVCLPGFADDVPASVERALELKKKVEKANAQDIETLWQSFQAKFQKMTEDDQTAFVKRLDARLAGDKESYREIRAILLKEKKGSYELKTSLVKLIGVEDEEGKVLFSGILDDARRWIAGGKAKSVLYGELGDFSVEKNQITVLKTILLYANVLLTEEPNLTKLADDGLEKRIQLMYSTPCPDCVDERLLKGVVLGCTGKENRLLIPNAGFVFGGNFVDGKCRGIDCSAFVSHCAKARVRMSTLYLDFLAREIQHGEKDFSKAELPIRAELIKDYKLSESKEDFEAIDVAAKLQPGDLVTWRSLKGASGHTVIYLAPVTGLENEFVAIEANREDNKSKEGIEVNTFRLVRPGVRTTILRRK